MREQFEVKQLEYALLWGQVVTVYSIFKQLLDLTRTDLHHSTYILIFHWLISAINCGLIFAAKHLHTKYVCVLADTFDTN